jgi:hypothetical protein
LIEKRYAHIDKHNETPAAGFRSQAKANFHAAMHNGDRPMNTILKLFDRYALGAIAAIAVVIMPFAAMSLLASAL